MKQVRLEQAGKLPKLKRQGGANWDSIRHHHYANWLEELEGLVGHEALYSGRYPPGIAFYLSEWSPAMYYEHFVLERAHEQNH